MLRRTGFTILTLTVLVLILALQLKEPDSTLMRLLNLRTASRQLYRHPQARRAFTPFTSQASTLSTSASQMASYSKSDEASQSTNRAVEESAGSESQEGTPLGLPAPPSTEEAEAIKFDMSNGGDTVKLDSLGPMVVNKDGSISRINNWAQMTEMEQKNTLRIVGKRNKQRLDALQTVEDGRTDSN